MTAPAGYDAIVIGAGMAGASVAYELGKSMRVIVLEAEGEVPFHTTGRSAAMLMPAYGNDAIRALTHASLPDFERLPGELGVVSLLKPRSVLYVADPESEGLGGIVDVSGVERVSAAEALGLFPNLRPDRIKEAAVDRSGSDIEVLNLHTGYVAAFRRGGGTVVRDAPVRSISRTDGVWTVQTPSGTFQAPVVVNAAGAWADHVAQLAGITPLGLRPLRRTAFVAPVEAPEGFSHWPFLMDAQERWYLKPEGDAVLGSPADETLQEPGDAKADQLDVAMALDQIREATTFPLRSVRTAWAGLRTFATDRSPVVGESTGTGFWWSAGQGGYGIQMAPALARCLAQMILTGGGRIEADYGLPVARLSPERF